MSKQQSNRVPLAGTYLIVLDTNGKAPRFVPLVSSIPNQTLSVIIGRGSDISPRITIVDECVSQMHALLTIDVGDDGQPRCTIRDLGSTNGTSVNGEPLVNRRPYPLKHCDVVNIGGVEMLFYQSSVEAIDLRLAG